MVFIDINGLDIPEYLQSAEFFSKALKIGLNLPDVEVKNIFFSMGTSGGDNYTSFIYRVKVQYSIGARSEYISVILKSIPIDGDREVFQKMKVYEKEVLMYSEILPAIDKLLGKLGLSRQIAPKLIYSMKNPVGTIVLQDLKDLKMELSNRTVGLDEEHSRLVMQKIGQYHAASMVVARNQPHLMQPFDKSMFDKSSDCELRRNIFKGNINDMADLVQLWHGFDDIAKKLRRIGDNFQELCEHCVAPRDGEIHVLNHGDLWVNNIMFKYEHGTPVDLMFVDFQLCYYTSPAIDLHYFLNTSVQLNVLITKRYQLLRTYYMAFASTLRSLNYFPIPSWEQIKRQLQEKEFYGFWAFEAVLPLVSMNKEDSKDNSVESFSNSEGAQRKRKVMFSSERFLNSIKYLLDRFDELGVLDQI